MMAENAVLETIFSRRSRRKFNSRPVSDESIRAILEAGRWAPSGLNNQPWRFSVIRDQDKKEELGKYTKDRRIVVTSNVCIGVFFNIPSGYNRDKDIMGMGACIQNMLLAAESLKIGAVWLGEILNKKDEVREALGINRDSELMAMLALGYSDENPGKDKKDLDNLILHSFY
jgi:nitroreductase